MSASEEKLWRFIRKKQLGFLFRRQYGIGPYSLDFYCPEVRVCVEVDGPHHEERWLEDRERDRYLGDLGILVIRIPSADLFAEHFQDVEKWLANIEVACRERRGPRNLHPRAPG